MVNPQYTVEYDVAALCILLCYSIFYFFKNRLVSQRSKSFQYLIFVYLSAIALDIVSAEVNMNGKQVLVPLLYLANIAFFICLIFVPVSFFHYSITLVQQKKMVSLKKASLTLIPAYLYIVFILTTPWTKAVFFIENNYYCYGKFHDLVYLFLLGYIIASIVVLGRNIQRVRKEYLTIAVVFCVVIIGCSLVQSVFFPEILFANFGGAICLVLIGGTIENPDYYLEVESNLLNSYAFKTITTENFQAEKKWVCYYLRITNDELNYKLYGKKYMTSINNGFCFFMKKTLKTKQVFHLSKGTYAFLFLSDKEDNEGVTQLFDYLKKGILIDEKSIEIEFVILKTNCPSEAKSYEDLQDISQYASKRDLGRDVILTIDQEIKENIYKENQLQRIVDCAFLDDSFMIRMQPIYDSKQKKFTTFEVLSSLYNEKIGRISPSLFMPIIEESHYVNQFGKAIFEKTCSFLKENDVFSLGIENVKINISPLQCRDSQMADHMIEIASKYGIPMSKMEFEIVESAILGDEENVWRNINKLKSVGVNFAIDDYGTGYSNLIALIKTPVKHIKIDKGILWACTRGENNLLCHLIPMFSEHGFDVVCEGVETEKQKDLLEKLGCRYLQGYLFSKALEPVKFIEFLKERL